MRLLLLTKSTFVTLPKMQNLISVCTQNMLKHNNKQTNKHSCLSFSKKHKTLPPTLTRHM